MHWVAASVMCAIYLYNLPLVFVVYLDQWGLRFGLGVLEARFAKKNADKHKKKDDPKKRRFALMKKHMSLRVIVDMGLRLAKTIRLERLDVAVTIGTGDAACTAETCGLLLVVLSTIRAVTSAPGRIRVTPDFSKRAFSGEACGIVRLCAGHIMKAALLSILRGTGG